MSDIRVTVGPASLELPAGSTAERACTAAGVQGAVAVRLNAAQVLRDLATPLADGDSVDPIPVTSEEGRAVLRHSTAHVLAQAVQDLFPGTKLGIGPPIENGFYYDFGVEHPFTPDDLGRIESRMREIVAAGQIFRRRVVTEEEARTELADQPYKLELVGLKSATGEEAVEAGGPDLTIYDNVIYDSVEGDRTVWSDLCRGPHLPSTRQIAAFRLTRSSAAYWRGSEANPQLQRIYGTAWESRDALKEHLRLLEEAEKRDHRKLGTELDLFSFPPEIGGGLAVWHPRGGAVRRAMEDYSRAMHEQAGYEFVVTPHIARAGLFETSGHLQWYAEGMYPPMQLEGAAYYPKPMNCPFHILIYRSRGRSYRDLPLRLFEFGTVYRFEKSGVLHGLTRARGFTQDDSHIFTTPDQLSAELTSLLAFVLTVLRDFGLTEFEAELATRPDKFVGEPEEWAAAEAALQVALEAAGIPFVIAAGEGAFYAPKIDLHIKDALGRRWQLSTLQVDLQLPARFDITYQAADGSRQRPCMIHRALF
ncbi:MAG: threonine--tRNA ligase, partial [Mycobacteriales bacterium]